VGRLTRTAREAGHGDEGFTLVEILTSIALLGTVMAAMGPFFVRSIRSISSQRSAQAAVELADTAMEQVRSLRGSALVAGRGQVRSTAQWNAAPAAMTAYKNSMKLMWDTTLSATDPSGDNAAIPTISQTLSAAGTKYTRTTYVGACEIYTAPGATAGCVAPWATPPAAASDDQQFFRVVVLVQWSDSSCKDGISPVGTCSFVATTLISRGEEPTFDVHRPPPVVTSTAATFYKGVAGTYQLEVDGGDLPLTWNLNSGPAGMTVNGGGRISWTPGSAGSFTAKVTVTDKSLRSDTKDIAVTVLTPLTLSVSKPAPKYHVGEVAGLTLTPSGGTAPFAFTAPNLPPGTMLDPATGAITGNPDTAGSYPVTGGVTDSKGGTAQTSFTVTVYPAVAVAAIADQTVPLGSAVGVTAAGSGGGTPLSYSATGLPVGVTINSSTGALVGAAGVAGRYLPTVTVTDGLGGSGGTATTTFALTVTSSLNFTSPNPAAPDQTDESGKNTKLKFTTDGTLPVINVTGLPPGLTFDALNNEVSGKPTTPGVYTVTATATTALPPDSTTLVFRWTIT
jgi:prepilin-type N-terminal cleavage/methylation domain-containing protein